MLRTKPLQILSVTEPWAEAKLQDGTTIRVKIVFVDAQVHVDEKDNPIRNEQGDMQYIVNCQQVLQTIELSKDNPNRKMN